MKKIYTKPLISVEAMNLDQPIAAGCSADFDDVQSLVDMGLFGPGDGTCMYWLGPGDEGRGGKYDWDTDGVWDDEDPDGICYHSNITVAFVS